MTLPASYERRDAVDGLAVGLMIVLTFTWGFNQVAIKVANSGYNPIFVSVIRAAVGGAILYGWCRWRGTTLFERDGTLWPGVLVGCIFAAQFTLIFMGMDYTTAARGALTLNAMPFWVLIGAHFLLGERITLIRFCGLMLAFAGVALVFADELSLPDQSALTGDVMCLVAGILWAGTIIVVKRSALQHAPPEKTLLYQLAVSTLVAIPLIPIGGPLVRDGNLLASLSVVFQALFVVGVTYPAWYWLIWRYPAPSLSSFTFLTPVFGVICGGVLLNEPLSMNIFMALALIAAGLFLVNRPIRRVPPG
jgi:drug/metabolite transporter (DMT)-like permease